MAEGQLFKPEKDYIKEVDKQLPEAEELVKDNVQAALEKLSALEKHTRQVRAIQDIINIPCWSSSQTDVRSCLYIKTASRHNHDFERLWRLGSIKWTDSLALEEAWPAQADYHKDGTGCHVIYRWSIERREEADANRDITDRHWGQGMAWYTTVHLVNMGLTCICRSSSKLSERVSLVFYSTWRRNRAISTQRQTYYTNYKSRPLNQWNEEKRQSLFLNKWRCV